MLLELSPEETRREAALSLIKKEELKRLLPVLNGKGIEVLLIKGMPLSYLIYPRPYLRAFFDVDLFIRKRDFEPVRDALIGMGYTMPNAVTGEQVAHQRSFERTDAFGVEHIFDIHWKISNPSAFSDLISFEESWERAIPVPALDQRARTLCLEHALLLACVHRVAHHAHEQRACWLQDIHLIAERMSESEFSSFEAAAAAKRMTAVCRDGISAANKLFGTKRSFGSGGISAARPAESSAAYLKPSAGLLGTINRNVKSLNSLADKRHYLYELAFPPSDYMMKKYSARHKIWLPFLYLRRMLAGLQKACTKPHQHSL